MSSDVRQRRAERVRSERWKHLLPVYGKYVLGALVVVAALGAAATLYKPGPGERFIHDHATFAVFVPEDDQKISFVHPDYDASKRGMGPPHMHVGDGKEMWHIEGMFPGGRSDLSLTDLFLYNSVDFRQGRLKLDTMGGHSGQEWVDEGNKTWQVYVSSFVGDQRQPFERVPGDYAAFEPQNLDKVLITYGDLTAAELARQQAAVPPVSGEPGG